ncbi:MAG: sigma 54-interacting transcriptional regulator [Planctomycetota bacterium JB042]
MRSKYRLSWVNRTEGELVFHVGGSATVGRSSDNEIAVDEEGVSRHHCRLETRGDGLFVEDLGSTNGTFLNGRRIRDAELADGDELLVGRSLFRVHGGRDKDDAAGRTLAVGAETIQVALKAAHADYPGDLSGSTRAVDHLRTLCRVVDAINAGGSPDDLYRQALDAVLDTLDMESGAVVLGDDPGAEPAVRIERSDGPARAPSRTILRRVLESGEAVLANDVAGDARWKGSTSLVGQGEARIVCAPIAVAGRGSGALYLASGKEGRPVGESELRLVTLVARQLALAAENLHRTELLVAENRSLRAAAGDVEIVGTSAAMARVLETARRAAAADATVLVTGETGTGKELVARAIHGWSARRDRPFVALNCGAIPATMVESELFGHEKGTFTGAAERRLGRFEMADGGTLLLDEVGELPLETQVKLLRVLEEKRFYRVGGSKEVAVDVRILAATNRDLDARVRDGSFRPDLLFRLRVLEIEVPPLRERSEDVGPLAEALLARLARGGGRPAATLTEEASERLAAYPWPGNVRELRNVLERALILCGSDTIGADDVLPEGAGSTPPDGAAPVSGGGVRSLRDAERETILAALEATGWNKSKAAELLGIGRTNIYEKIKLYGLAPDD